VIVLLDSECRRKAVKDVKQEMILEVDELESISDKNEGEDIPVKGEGMSTQLHMDVYWWIDLFVLDVSDETNFAPVDATDAEIIPDIKPTLSLETPIPEITSAPAEDVPTEEPIQKEGLREEGAFAVDDARAVVVQDMERELPPTPVDTPSEETRPAIQLDLPIPDIPALFNDEQPPTPVSAELDITDVAIADTPTRVRSDSPLSSIISISPPPPTRQKKTKRPRIEDPSEDDHLDTSPPEYATLTPHGLGEVTTQINNHYLYVFYRFCAERHKMTTMRNNGVPRDSLTEDECMKKERVGNIYRELDPSSKRSVEDVIGKGDQTNEEICCESIEDEDERSECE
jgi:hypothetical protein